MTNPDGYTNPDDVSGASEGAWAPIGMMLGGFYDTYQSARTSRWNTERTIAAQKEQAELAYQRQVEMWHLQNQYNSPQQQMERFGAAGLNPHLIYNQGGPGNANSTPSYQAPNLQYRYEAPAYGAAASTAIQQLMQVGTWMQNMKLSEQEIQTKGLSLDFLGNVNPRKLQELDNRLSMYPYQATMQRALAQKSYVDVAGLQQEFQHKYGKPAADSLSYDPKFGGNLPKGGLRDLQLLQQLAKTKIDTAKASWTDYNITDPQALVQLVLGGVMGMAGTTLRLNTKARNVPERVREIGRGQRGRWSLRDWRKDPDNSRNRFGHQFRQP